MGDVEKRRLTKRSQPDNEADSHLGDYTGMPVRFVVFACTPEVLKTCGDFSDFTSPSPVKESTTAKVET